jgi:NitT/TauT family transport system ATP-binding protein
VQEAVYLAEKVVVMSARPGRIKAVVDTKFENNDSSLFKSPAFADKVDEIWNMVKAEAIRAQEARAS